MAHFHEAFLEALESALSKFDDLNTYFSVGMKVPQVSLMFAAEIRQDKDFMLMLAAPEHEEQLLPLIKREVGIAYGVWRKNGRIEAGTQKTIRDNPLPWPSIDNYPEWVFGQINDYRQAALADQSEARARLEHTFLEVPLHAVTIKYDGTCFGKLDTGNLVGRRTLLGDQCAEYQQTSTAAAKNCDVAALRVELSTMLGVELLHGSVCVWGELMCNPGFYGYQERGLVAHWLCFGVIAELPLSSTEQLLEISQILAQRGMAHNLSQNGRLRLLLCPSLRQLLQEVAGCNVVDDMIPCTTHLDVVAKAAAGLAKGSNEGLVLVFCRDGFGQSSLRKWKNSAEGRGISKKHARLLRSLDTRALVIEGRLDARIADMVETIIAVAEADTAPIKIGRRFALAR